MALIDVARPDQLERAEAARMASIHAVDATSASAVSWGAILAGAAGAAALSLILLILGTGLGLSSVSPWASNGISATTLGVSTIAWLTFTQLFASGIGGYLAGRLRSKWTAVHTDEVYFRDTAHGFLAWAVASLATAALLTSTIGAILGNGLQAGASAAGSAATATTVAAAAAAGGTAGAMGSGSTRGESSTAYFVDSLFRSGSPPSPAAAVPAADAASASPSPASTPAAGTSMSPTSTDARTPAPVAEAARIFVNGLRAGSLPADDARYLAKLIAERTGVPQQEAERRVASAFERLQTGLRDADTAAREAADKARKASAYAALWLFISLLFGAFVASLAATFGGRQRHA